MQLLAYKIIDSARKRAGRAAVQDRERQRGRLVLLAALVRAEEWSLGVIVAEQWPESVAHSQCVPT